MQCDFVPSLWQQAHAHSDQSIQIKAVCESALMSDDELPVGILCYK